jgi:hypothetical protein
MRNEAFNGVTETAYTYEAGRRTRAVETGPGGERQTLWSYDEAGRRSKEVVIDGAAITTRTFHYDRELLVREDVHDSAVDRVVIQHRRHYDNGGVLRERSEAHWSANDWVVVDHHALHYDDEGRFVYELRTRTPLEGARLLESITVDVDRQGRVIARRVDEGMDGSFERVSLFDFDDDGRLATATLMEADAIDSVARHTYDDAGQLIRTAVEDADGGPLSTTTYDFSCWE